jgi:hypothetical protein
MDASTLARELAKLPLLNAQSSAALNATRLALTRAIASGQSTAELAAGLSVPAAWQQIDFSQPPAIALPSTTGTAAAAPAPRTEQLRTSAILQPPEWAAAVIQLALDGSAATRVAILDREPTALGGLELPAWARAMKATATIGPIDVQGQGLEGTGQRWLNIYSLEETVEFVRGGTVLCVVPLSVLQIGPLSEYSISAGSVWISANAVDASAPAGSFAGIAVQSGQIASNQELSLNHGTVTLAAGQTLSLLLVPTALSAGPAGFPASVTTPPEFSVEFPASGAASITCGDFSATVYGEALDLTAMNQPPAYSGLLQMLYIPGTALEAEFAPQQAAGKVLALSGAARIASGGWALAVSQTTNPATLGTALGPGWFALSLEAGLGFQWTGVEQPEMGAGGALIAGNDFVAIAQLSGSAPGVLVEQPFGLWTDQDAPAQTPCHLVTGRWAGDLLLYALTLASEVLELAAAMEARVDRPVLASGQRVRALFNPGLLVLARNGAQYRLYAFSTTPVAQLTANGSPRAFPMALDNALLEVNSPQALYLYARTDASFNAMEAWFLLLFGYRLAELYLPDPYAGGLGLVSDEPVIADTAAAAESKGVTEGYLLASVIAPTAANARLRLSDLAHVHPAAPPTDEASSGPLESGLPAQLTPQDASSTGALLPAAAATETLMDVRRTPAPLPALPAGAMLLDVSTRASQLGVEVTTNQRAVEQYTIDGLSVRGPANLLPLATLPAMAWEPMYNLSPVADPSVDNSRLLHPPNDGPVTVVRANSATLIPIAPLPSLGAILNAGKKEITAQFTLPFGMVGVLDADPQNGTILPDVGLVRPHFSATLTPTGPYTGAWQLSIAAPDPSQADPVLAGRTYLRTSTDNPASPTLSYGEMVLGADVADIFSSRFDPPVGSTIGTGVPLRRYDLTGYGASTFSEWTNLQAATTDVIKSFFHVLVGRTSHEVIQVQSLVYPWAIRVVRTITIDRQASGVIERYDSGWQAASDGLFAFPEADTGIGSSQIHAGVLGGVIQVKNIGQVGLPLTTTGTQDGTGAGTATPAPATMSIPVQPVTFDAEVIIQPQHHVVQGGSVQKDLSGQSHTCLPSTGITGYIPLQYDYHLSLVDMADFGLLAAGAGGPIQATIDLGGSNSLLRVTAFEAVPVNDAQTSNIGIACTVRGIPRLSSDGAWSVAARTQAQKAPTPLPINTPAPVVQPNATGASTPGTAIHYADPADIFRLAPGFNPPPATLYGFLQATGTQSNLLSRPILTVGSPNLTLGDALNVAHAGALLGAIDSFPGIAQCLQFLPSDLAPIANQLAAPSLSTTQNLQLQPSVRSTPVALISTSIADVNLYFYQQGDDLSQPADPANVVISLGSPTPPSWSLDVNHLSVGLVIPALGSTPVIWFNGGFHADADSTPSFPSFQTQFSSPLDVLATLFTILNKIASVLSPGSSTGPQLNTSFSGGTLAVQDNFSLPDIPLGPGTISNVSLNIGAALDIVALNIDFLVGIGTPNAPCQWIVDPLSGTVMVQAGIQNNALAIIIQGGIGLGLAIDLGIASGSASIVVAVRLQIDGSTITILFLLTGQAQVTVLGGLASAAISLTAGLGCTIQAAASPPNMGLIGTAAVGIHISICWVINISFSGSWTFQKQLPFNP